MPKQHWDRLENVSGLRFLKTRVKESQGVDIGLCIYKNMIDFPLSIQQTHRDLFGSN